MKLVNDTPLPLAWAYGDAGLGRPALTFVVKATLDLEPGGVARLAEEQAAPCGDVPDAAAAASLRYASDFAPFKPRGEALLVGTCRPPGGRPATTCMVAFGVNDWTKRLQVIGQRVVRRRLLVLQDLSEPEPFTAMRVGYDNAFGGPGFARNPAGRGIEPVRDAAGAEVRPMPTVLAPGRAVLDPDSTEEPAGFGPVPLTWAQRMERAGTYDAAWVKARWPWFPDDFDWRFFNAAPSDQQFPVYFRGDERVRFENLHAEVPVFESRLPGLRPRLVARAADAAGTLEEIALVLDTLWVDADAGRAALVWRGRAPAPDKKLRHLAGLVLALETLDGPFAAPEVHAQRLDEDAVEVQAEVEAEAAGDGESAEPEWKAEFDREFARLDEALAADEARIAGLLREIEAAEAAAPEAPKVLPLPAPVAPDDAAFLAELRATLSAAAQEEAALQAAVDALPAEVPGPVPDAAPEEEPPAEGEETPAPPWTRESAAAHAAAGGAFVRADLAGLDLSGLDWSGVDLTGANLEGARLAGTTLRGASLEGAQLAGADLTRAVLDGARLVEATLYAAVLVEASLAGAQLTRARFNEGADLTRANLRRVEGSAALWDGARLDGADFSGAVLFRATFEGAQLTGARFRGADAREARFAEAVLDDAVLSNANFFGATFEGARMRRTDCRDSNFFGAEFLDLDEQGSVWSGSLLGRTKKAAS